MRSTLVSAGALSLLAAVAFAAPAPTDYYPPPAGGYPAPEEGGYPAPAGGYPAPEGGYPAPEGGYPAPDGGYPAPDGGYPSPDCPSSIFTFTSTYFVKAVPGDVINGTESTPGEPGAVGYFNYGIVAHEDLICWNITLLGVTGDYKSPARTATHIHEGAKGASGPPRVVFPNPVGDHERRVSLGCMTGPFTTGVPGPDGKDTGEGFTLAKIEANPSGFFTDAHTVNFVPGVVRGQLG
ncbi:MAG: CorA metal ion transporter [Chaenotheca gracillima]|nr:MAG: CorA metal ion transporter [Chaenotheca gracillima]